eukprot:scaffold127222_cov32-Tisochrysis_lutea.AAC.12
MRHHSGYPVIEGEQLPVAEGDLWAFYASRSLHETNMVCLLLIVACSCSPVLANASAPRLIQLDLARCLHS